MGGPQRRESFSLPVGDEIGRKRRRRQGCYLLSAGFSRGVSSIRGGAEEGNADSRHFNADERHFNADSRHFNADSRHFNADSRRNTLMNAMLRMSLTRQTRLSRYGPSSTRCLITLPYPTCVSTLIQPHFRSPISDSDLNPDPNSN